MYLRCVLLFSIRLVVYNKVNHKIEIVNNEIGIGQQKLRKIR